MEDKVKESRAYLFLKKYLPFISFGLLIVILLLTSNLAGRNPSIESITPNTSFPGSELTITGKYFGKDRKGGKVQVSGISLATDAYQEWADSKIRIVVPDEMNSGLLKVVTMNGESRETVPFVNRKQIPIPISGPLQPGDVYIQKIAPEQGAIGTLVTIDGMNFGDEQGSSRIYFEWMSSDVRRNAAAPMFSSSIPAVAWDFDYEFWSALQVKVRVPDGALSGNVFVETENGRSNGRYFEVKEHSGKKRLGLKKIYQVYYWVKIKVLDAEPENSLSIWIPGIPGTPEQREVTLITSEPFDSVTGTNGIIEFPFRDLIAGDTRQIRLRYIFARYEIHTSVDPSLVRTTYDIGSHLYRTYTRPDKVIPSSEFKIISLARKIVGKETNPFLKAQAIYQYLTDTLSFPQDQDTSNHDVLRILDSGRPIADSYVYSVLFCALARAVGIPARSVAGYIACSDLAAVEHYWAEFYLDDFGWVPVDPILGDGKKYKDFTPQNNAKTYYFGNLDNDHITITRGYSEIEQKNVAGRVVSDSRFASFQSAYEESVGKINSYSTDWSSLGIIGVY
jgi:transglutaminase-like putative cysteine protease